MEKLSKEQFSEKAELLAMKSKIDIIDATLHIASQNNIEPETLNKFLSERLKELIRKEAVSRNLVKDEERATLPF